MGRTKKREGKEWSLPSSPFEGGGGDFGHLCQFKRDFFSFENGPLDFSIAWVSLTGLVLSYSIKKRRELFWGAVKKKRNSRTQTKSVQPPFRYMGGQAVFWAYAHAYVARIKKDK